MIDSIRVRLTIIIIKISLKYKKVCGNIFWNTFMCDSGRQIDENISCNHVIRTSDYTHIYACKSVLFVLGLLYNENSSWIKMT